MIRRHLTPRVLEALTDTPVVLLNGPRQAGKSTLAQAVASHEHPARYLTLDDATTLAAARSDPPGTFVTSLILKDSRLFRVSLLFSQLAPLR